MNIGASIKKIRKEKGLTLLQVCERTNFALQTGHLSRIERSLQEPSIHLVGKIADALNISLSGLILDALGEEVTSKSSKPQIQIPLVDWENIEDLLNNKFEPKEWIISPYKYPPKKKPFALHVTSDAMSQKRGITFNEGFIIIVEPGGVAASNSNVIAKLPNGEITFRQIKVDSGETWLVPLNDVYPVMKGDDIKILGTIKWTMANTDAA